MNIEIDLPTMLSLGGLAGLTIATLTAGLIGLKSIIDFSHAGPQIEGVIRRHYVSYVALSMIRLLLWVWLIGFWLSAFGIIIAISLAVILEFQIGFKYLLCAAGFSWVVCVIFSFSNHLLYQPGTLASNSNYRMSRFYSYWEYLSEDNLRVVEQAGAIFYVAIAVAATVSLAYRGNYDHAIVVAVLSFLLIFPAKLVRISKEPEHVKCPTVTNKPNVVMIGCDTLRADRTGIDGYSRGLTPTLDRLGREGVTFNRCFVPVARTAPSLITLFSGVWPQTHGIRDNFTTAKDMHDELELLPKLLSENGYQTKVISDWSGCDFSKFDFGFDEIDCAEDQWNLKYLIRQGPKDIRLFLSLFCGNGFGKRFLPELYFLAGNPMTGTLGLGAREYIHSAASAKKPFFLNLFCATAHPPFSVEYPYYQTYADKEYNGESKFSMSKLTDPMEIIAAQQQPKEHFDMQQLIDLYDGCVKRFDDEVNRILGYLEGSGLRENTIIVVYSDHGIELFENDTWGQGNSVKGGYSSRIPLVISDPRLPPTGSTNQLVRTVDFMPTLLQLLDIEIPKSVEGVSLVDLMTKEKQEINLAAYTETGIWIAKQYQNDTKHLNYPDILKIIDVTEYEQGTLEIKDEFKHIVVAARDRMVRFGNWGITFAPLTDGVEWGLYNTATDPNCLTDLKDVEPERFAAMKDRMFDWLQMDDEVISSRLLGT